MKPAENKNYRIIEYTILAGVFLLIYYLIQLPTFSHWEDYVPFTRQLSISIFLICLILAVGKVTERVIDTRSETTGHRYNLIRITRLLTATLGLIIAVAFIFQAFEIAIAGFAIISVVLGLALQSPITSFIAWIYIIFRAPYRVGDRIQINEHRGDVIEISYLDTTIEECSGDYLENDKKSGRLINFPNSIILREQVINYSGSFIPFIWNETAVQISYTSDLKFVEACLKEAAVKDFKEQYPYRDIRGNEPDVYFRVNIYAWLEAVVSYPVEPRDTTGRRNRILRYALPLLNEESDRVGFPEGNKR